MTENAVDVPASTRKEVADLAEKHGVLKASRLLGMSREALTRVIADLPIRAGTLALIERNLSTARRGETPR